MHACRHTHTLLPPSVCMYMRCVRMCAREVLTLPSSIWFPMHLPPPHTLHRECTPMLARADTRTLVRSLVLTHATRLHASTHARHARHARTRRKVLAQNVRCCTTRISQAPPPRVVRVAPAEMCRAPLPCENVFFSIECVLPEKKQICPFVKRHLRSRWWAPMQEQPVGRVGAGVV